MESIIPAAISPMASPGLAEDRALGTMLSPELHDVWL